MTSNNADLLGKAEKHIPGGVNSPVRAFLSVGGTPPFIVQGEGCRIQDAEGRWYVDYVGSWGPLICGHAHPQITATVQEAVSRGLSFGATTQGEVELADLLCEIIPSLDMLRLTSSGTEATMSAIRLARGATKRDLIIKFEGCYHGHADGLLVKAGSGALTFGHPSSDGVPADVAKHTLILRYNDNEQLSEAFARHGDKLAAVIVEPVAGNMNLIKPQSDFLQNLRKLTEKHGAILIFDEVMTGFRVGLTGAQGLYGITPDLSTFGKVIGGGMPLGAFGGRHDLMQHLAPLGPVYQAGTLSGNPIAVAAGLAQLQLLRTPGFYDSLADKTKRLCNGLQAAASESGVVFSAQSVGSMFGFYFASCCPTTYAEVTAADQEAFRRFFHAMLEEGYYFAPSAFEAGFMSSAHTDKDIDNTLAAASTCFSK